MLTLTATTTRYGTVTLSAPRGNDYAWRTTTGARVSAYCQTVRDAQHALYRLSR